MRDEEIRNKRNPLLVLASAEWHNLHDKKPTYFLYLFLFFMNGLIGLSQPLLIGLIFNSIQNQITNESQLWNLISLIGLLLVVEVLSWVFLSTARYLERNTGFLVGKNYLNKKFSKVLDLPVEWHKDNHSGDTIDKINKGSNSVTEYSQHTTFQVIRMIMNLFGSAIVLMFFDFNAAIISLLFSFFILFIITRFDRRLIPMYKERNKFENKASAAIFDYVSNIMTVITLRLKKTVQKEINLKTMASENVQRRIAFIDETKWAFAGISIQAMVVLLLSFRAYSDFHNKGIIMVGTIYILYGYLERMGNTFYSLAWLYGDIVKMGSRIENSEPIEEEYEKIKGKLGGGLKDNWKEIKIRGLDFTYDKEGRTRHLENIDLSFKKGERIALVGESGSGKSTLLALIRGLYEPDKVKVFCDNNFLKNSLHHLSDYVTLIPQDPEIFNNTIRFNVAMGIPYKTSDIIKAIKLARFDKVVDRLEKGLNANVMEKGVSLSGGEKQRLALARGLLAAKDSDIVLLDEPTSSVDSLNESKIHDNIFSEFKGKTIISSIHRLHLLNKFDKIYFFERGKIIASGSLDEVKRNQKFNDLLRKYKNVKDK